MTSVLDEIRTETQQRLAAVEAEKLALIEQLEKELLEIRAMTELLRRHDEQVVTPPSVEAVRAGTVKARASSTPVAKGDRQRILDYADAHGVKAAAAQFGVAISSIYGWRKTGTTKPAEPTAEQKAAVTSPARVVRTTKTPGVARPAKGKLDGRAVADYARAHGVEAARVFFRLKENDVIRACRRNPRIEKPASSGLAVDPATKEVHQEKLAERAADDTPPTAPVIPHVHHSPVAI